jgi:hypothetical protein
MTLYTLSGIFPLLNVSVEPGYAQVGVLARSRRSLDERTNRHGISNLEAFAEPDRRVSKPQPIGAATNRSPAERLQVCPIVSGIQTAHHLIDVVA